jgi:hypothetical protein
LPSSSVSRRRSPPAGGRWRGGLRLPSRPRFSSQSSRWFTCRSVASGGRSASPKVRSRPRSSTGRARGLSLPLSSVFSSRSWFAGRSD